MSTDFWDIQVKIKERNRQRIRELEDSTGRILTQADQDAATLQSVYIQYRDGAITLAEFNLRMMEFMHLINTFSYQMNEMYMLEEAVRS